MDVLIYIGLIVLTGLFYFLSLFPEKSNVSTPYLFIIFLTSTFFILQIVSDPYICTGTNTTITYNSTGNVIGSLHEPIKQDLGGWNYVLILSNLMFMILAIMNITLGKERFKGEELR